MNSILVAVAPESLKSQKFESFSKVLRLFQEKKLFRKTSIVSIIHPAMYLVPNSWYDEFKKKYAAQTLKELHEECRGHFSFEDLKVLISNNSSNESIVDQISEYAQKHGSEMMIVSSQERSGLPYWILGSFAQTASLTAKLPVLVIKPGLTKVDFNQSVRFVVGIDVATPYSPKSLRSISNFANQCGASVDLVYVKPKRRIIINSAQKRKSEIEAKKKLEEIKLKLKNNGAQVKVVILREKDSIAQTMVDYAENKKAWVTITLSAKRSITRKLILGSQARNILALSRRPFLSLR